MKKYKFHNVDLSYNQQVEIIEFHSQQDPIFADIIQTAVEGGYKVSFSYDEYHDTGLMSITPKDKEHTFYGYVCILRHDDLHTLAKVLYWLNGGGWEKIEKPERQNGKYAW